MYTWYFIVLLKNNIEIKCKAVSPHMNAIDFINGILIHPSGNPNTWYICNNAKDDAVMAINIENILTIAAFTPDQWKSL